MILLASAFRAPLLVAAVCAAVFGAPTAARGAAPPEGAEEETPPAEAPPPAFADAVAVDEGVSAALVDGRDIVLRLQLDAPEAYARIAGRVGGDERLADALCDANGGAPAVPGRMIVVPWPLVRAEYRYLALRAIFPADRFRDGAWEHYPAQSRLAIPAEGLWQVALWFTGEGDRWQDLTRANNLTGALPPADGRPVRIPEGTLLPLFRPVSEGPGGLHYGEDAQGPFAERPLGRGETLYSGVVIRFTDLTRPDDVNGAAEIIRERSGIPDVRKMEVGQKVRIPLDLLATPYLPDNDPRRVAARLHEAEIAGLAPSTEAVALQGVHVLLDVGHGGDDIGAHHGRIWESDYVYDVACRVQRLLKKDTAATVHLLVRDLDYGCRVFDRKRLPRNRREVVDTHPPLKIRRGATDVAVNLRWYLANAEFRELTGKADVPAEKIVFISLHADSLHSAMRGSTIYIPGERRRGAVHGEGGRAYQDYREWRLAPQISVSRADRLRDEAVSRRLAGALLAGLREERLPVHEDQPIRDQIVRGRGTRRAWLPAVLRGNLVPAKVLLETVNLGNDEDARILEDPAGRERIARAVVAGLTRYYSRDQARVAGRPVGASR